MTAAATQATSLPLFDETLLRRDERGFALIGWRCDGCGRLAFGHKRMCPICGTRAGRDTTLRDDARLETWTTVSTKAGSYTVAYVLVGDGEDDQEVRVFGPIRADDMDTLEIGRRVRIAFDHSPIAGQDSVHHVFHTDGPTREDR